MARGRAPAAWLAVAGVLLCLPAPSHESRRLAAFPDPSAAVQQAEGSPPAPPPPAPSAVSSTTSALPPAATTASSPPPSVSTAQALASGAALQGWVGCDRTTRHCPHNRLQARHDGNALRAFYAFLLSTSLLNSRWQTQFWLAPLQGGSTDGSSTQGSSARTAALPETPGPPPECWISALGVCSRGIDCCSSNTE